MNPPDVNNLGGSTGWGNPFGGTYSGTGGSNTPGGNAGGGGSLGGGNGAPVILPLGPPSIPVGLSSVPIPGVNNNLPPPNWGTQPNPTGLGGAGQVMPGSVLGNNQTPMNGLGPNGTIPGTYVDANGYTVQPSFNYVNGQIVLQ